MGGTAGQGQEALVGMELLRPDGCVRIFAKRPRPPVGAGTAALAGISTCRRARFPLEHPPGNPLRPEARPDWMRGPEPSYGDSRQGERDKRRRGACMSWYYLEAKKQVGPVDDAEFQALLAQGRIQPATMVWRTGMGDWRPYREVAESKPAPSPIAPPTGGTGLRLSGGVTARITASAASEAAATAGTAGTAGTAVTAGTGAVVDADHGICAECGEIAERGSMIRHANVLICARCKPKFIQRLREGAASQVLSAQYAGFWIRFAAKFLDGLILGVVFMAPLLIVMFSRISSSPPGQPPEPGILEIVLQLGYYVASMVYSIVFVGKYGATPGKMACRIRIVRSDGAPVSYGRATGRFFAEIISGMICYAGYIMAGFDEEKRSLHDRICDTRVVYK